MNVFQTHFFSRFAELEKGISEAEQAIKKELAARRRKQELERNVKVIQVALIVEFVLVICFLNVKCFS